MPPPDGVEGVALPLEVVPLEAAQVVLARPGPEGVEPLDGLVELSLLPGVEVEPELVPVKIW